jgi:hypothetical protein
MRSDDDASFYLDPGTSLMLDGERIGDGEISYGWTLAGRTEEGTDTLVQLARTCAKIRVRVPTAAVRAAGTGGVGAIGFGGGGSGRIGVLGGVEAARPKTWRVRSGAKAFWPDGVEAGVSTSSWSTAVPPVESGGRRCFPQRGLTICHDAADVTEE